MIDSDGECMWHNGQTGGYHSFVAFSPTENWRRHALRYGDRVDRQIGSQLIRKQIGMPPGSRRRCEVVALSAEQIKNVVGDYRVGLILKIRRNGKGMTAKLGAQPAFPIYFDSEGAAFTNRSLHESLSIWATTERHDH